MQVHVMFSQVMETGFSVSVPVCVRAFMCISVTVWRKCYPLN